MKKSILKKYAHLAVSTGINVQKGQDVLVYAEHEQPEFVEYVVEECYKAGARHVKVEWEDTPKITKAKYKYETVDTIADVPAWVIERMKHFIATNPARLYIASEDPDGLKGINQQKMASSSMKRYPIIKPYIDQMENQYQWSIVAVPGRAWAKKVFPNVTTSKAMELLWDAILKTARVNDDPIQAWKDHNADLLKRCEYLNGLNLDYLHYESKNGTDFKVWMLDKCLWLGGGETSLKGIFFNPNIPSEECFTSPIRGKAEGKVVASLPLSYQGQMIENFDFVFKEGKVVECHAEKNEELLKKMISMDEGASYLGECALVPFESPINQTGVLFYNTLFDENAACHLALGRGFSNCVKDYEKYQKADFDAMGINDSMIHVDFMIGNRDMKITGHTRDGKIIPIFKNGTWAF